MLVVLVYVTMLVQGDRKTKQTSQPTKNIVNKEYVYIYRYNSFLNIGNFTLDLSSLC